MISGLFISLSGVISSFRRHAVTANNVANVATPGYKTSRLLSRDNPTGGVDSTQVARVHSQGPLIQTAQPLDLTIMGEGFFQVELNDGRVGYSRCGVLTVDPEGRLSTVDGHCLLPRVTVPANAAQLIITSGGEIQATIGGERRTLGQIEMARFTNPAGLAPVGHGLFVESPASGPPITDPPGSAGMGTLVQGGLEGSNVDLTTEFVMDILSVAQLKANLSSLKTQ